MPKDEQDIELAVQAFTDHIALTQDSPCVDCDHRKNLYCTFYQTELFADNGYIFPSEKCDDDTCG